ncbi:MAG: hypothetical protein QG622_909 [Actinomycetota bacterium]|nr:hypothetical protein [Actinomycetota bacterium]
MTRPADRALQTLLAATGMDAARGAVDGAEAAVSSEVAEAIAVLVSQVADAAVFRDELVAALVETQNQLLSVYAIAQIQTASMTPAEVESRLLEVVADLTKADAVALVTPAVTRTHGSDADARWLEGQVTGHLDAPGIAPAQVEEGDRTALIWPLPSDDGVTAALALLRRGPTDTGLRKLMSFLVEIVASIRTRAFLQEEQIRRAGIAREHEAASRLAQAALPSRPPFLPGCEIAESTRPARSAGGDFYTHVVVDENLLFAVGDVAGKGLPAALVMTKVIAACMSAFASHRPDQIGDVAAQLCDELYPYLSDVGLFVTVLLGGYVPGTGTLFLFNAGHSPTLIVTAEGTTTVKSVMPPLGVLPTPSGKSVEIRLRHGDLLVVGSDGLTEQEDHAGRLFGYDRFTSMLGPLHGRKASDVSDHLLRLVDEHGRDVPASDDQTLFVLRHGDGAEASPPGDSSRVPVLSTTTLDATHLAVRALGPWLADLCGHLGTADVLLPQLGLALHEVCVNVVDHGYGGTPGTITVSGRVDGPTVHLEVRDRGREFDEASVVRPTPGVPQIRGYGLMLVEQLVDSVDYLRDGDENVWRLTTRWDRP